MFVSHAQNFEDVMLWRALKHIKNGFYIDAGAQDPDIDSVTLAFYEQGWRGVHIEPMRDYAEKLKLSRKDELVLEVALSDKTGLINFYDIPNTGLSTISPDIAANHANAGFQGGCRQVPCTPLSEILKNHSGKDIHFLKIDVEGHEEAVIRGNDWKVYRPWIVVVEATLPDSQTESYEEWEYILLDSDYQFVYADGLNRFYVAKEHNSLAKAFRYPPNIFDGFISTRQATLEVRAQELELKAEQAQANIVRADMRNRQSEERADLLKVRANEAEDIAAQAETRAAQAEAKLNHFYARATDAEARAEAIETSLSWRLTRPLRRFNPQHLISPFVRGIASGLRALTHQFLLRRGGL
jgi:FkbM family methyltransferase